MFRAWMFQVVVCCLASASAGLIVSPMGQPANAGALKEPRSDLSTQVGLYIMAQPTQVRRRMQLARQRARQIEQVDLAGIGPRTPALAISAARLWRPPNGQLKVCFFDGDAQARREVLRVARRWLSDKVALRLDGGAETNPRQCTTAVMSDIRITFRGRSRWSVVGAEAINLLGQSEASMSLAGLDREGAWRREAWDAAVLRMFGHAFGFGGEFSSHAAGCVKAFSEAGLKALAGAPFFWDGKAIQAALVEADDATALYKPGEASVMRPTFPAALFDAPAPARCTETPANALTVADRRAIAALYPVVKQLAATGDIAARETPDAQRPQPVLALKVPPLTPPKPPKASAPDTAPQGAQPPARDVPPATGVAPGRSQDRPGATVRAVGPAAATPPAPLTYTVKQGDTLIKLARRFLGRNTAWRVLATANGIKDPTQMRIGQRLIIPARRQPTTSTTAGRQGEPSRKARTPDRSAPRRPARPERNTPARVSPQTIERLLN